MNKKDLEKFLKMYADGVDIQSLLEDVYDCGYDRGYDEGKYAEYEFWIQN